MPLFDTEQLISNLRVTLLDILHSLSDSEGGIIPVSEVCEVLLKVDDNLDKAVSKQVGNSARILVHVCEVLLKVHDILDKAVSKQVGNSACILVHVFKTVSRKHHEVWASQSEGCYSC